MRSEASDVLIVQILEQVEGGRVPVSYVGVLGCLPELGAHHIAY